MPFTRSLFFTMDRLVGVLYVFGLALGVGEGGFLKAQIWPEAGGSANQRRQAAACSW
jgi:hypothetical protein